MAKNFQNKKGFDEPRINDEINDYNVVRLIYKEHSDSRSENDFSKIVSWNEAKNLSEEMCLDLVEVNSKTSPPIIRLCNYSKFLWELKRQNKNKNKNTVSIKEIQLSVNISSHDLNVKLNKAKDFISDGHKVKVVLTMKGRELSRREISKECFYTFIKGMADIATIDGSMKDEGNKAIVIFKKK